MAWRYEHSCTWTVLLYKANLQHRQNDPSQWGKEAGFFSGLCWEGTNALEWSQSSILKQCQGGDFPLLLVPYSWEKGRDFFVSAVLIPCLCFVQSISCFAAVEQAVCSWKTFNFFHKRKILFSLFFHDNWSIAPVFPPTWDLFLLLLYLFLHLSLDPFYFNN